AGVRRAGTVGKPATMFQIAPEAEPLLSAAHAPVLRALLVSLSERLSGPALEELFRDAGRRLGAENSSAEPSDTATLETRVRAAAALLTALGGEVDVEREGDSFVIRGYAC